MLELIMEPKKSKTLNLSDEREKLERFLQSLDSRRYHRILGDAVTHPFYLDPNKMYTLRELPDLLPPDRSEKKKEKTK